MWAVEVSRWERSLAWRWGAVVGETKQHPRLVHKHNDNRLSSCAIAALLSLPAVLATSSRDCSPHRVSSTIVVLAARSTIVIARRLPVGPSARSPKTTECIVAIGRALDELRQHASDQSLTLPLEWPPLREHCPHGFPAGAKPCTRGEVR